MVVASGPIPPVAGMTRGVKDRRIVRPPGFFLCSVSSPLLFTHGSAGTHITKVLEDTNYVLLTESNTLYITMCSDSRSMLRSSLLRFLHTTATMATTTSPTTTSINTALTTTAITMVTSCDGAVVLGGGEVASIRVSE